MQKVSLNILIGLMVIALVTAIFLSFAPLLVPGPVMPFEHLPSLVFSTAALIAIFTYKQTRDKADQENIRSRSVFFFEQARNGLDEVLDLLRDQNNYRIIWVRAARSLLQAQKIAKDIELEEYQRAYRLHGLRVRNDLYLALTIHDPATGHRQPLPPQFFYGLPDWKEDSEADTSLDDVAIKASNPIVAYRVTLDNVPQHPSIYPLSTESVIAIFDFLEYPRDYEDPLREVDDWEVSWSDVHNEKAGAARYIHHKKTKYVEYGNLDENDSRSHEESE